MEIKDEKRNAAVSPLRWISRLGHHVGLVVGTVAAAFLLVLGVAQQGRAQSFAVLHTFGGPDGANPRATLIMDSGGNLYGTTAGGGADGFGTVFKLDTSGKETVLHSFTGPDGASPGGSLVMDAAGNLYGTTSGGGADGFGTVFKLDTSGKETVLHSFTNANGDGEDPLAGLVIDAAGNLYGTTIGGGSGQGTVFKVDGSGNESVLHRFRFFDGSEPYGGLVMDKAGNLYGTTVGGGANGVGTVFKIDPSGNETVLYSFAPYRGDGENPYGGLIIDSDGNLYGTTLEIASGYGSVFKLDTSNSMSVLYRFKGVAAGDGEFPWGGRLVMDKEGNLYGTTFYGGSTDCGNLGCGIAFKLDPSGDETVLHSFTGSEGANPFAGLVMDNFGNLYGATFRNGSHGDGTIFKLVLAPPSSPSPEIGPSGTTTNPQATVAEPISTGNGNYFYHHTDFVIPGPGLPIIFKRSYNSLDDYSGPLGANWTHTYNIVLTQPSSTLVSIKWGDGHGEIFSLNGGVYVPQPGVFSTLVKNADGTFLLTRKNQTRYHFDAAGKLTSVQDKNGNAIALTYDSNGNLTLISNAAGRSLALSYDTHNRIIRIADPLGRTVSFTYDGNDNLASVTNPLNGTATFAYDASHRVTSIMLPDGNILLQNTYDSQGRVISQTNGRNFTWTFAYDTPGSGETTITDPKGNKTVHTYDGHTRIVKIADTQGGTISYTYDGTNDRTSVTNQDGKTTQFAYDASGNVTGITDALGNTAAFSYDAGNDLLSATNPKGKTTTFSYDSNGNLLSIRDALGHTTAFAHNGAGQLTSRTDADGHTTTYGYNSSGDLTRVTDALGDATQLAYDGIGRLVSVTDPNGHSAHASYDGLSRLTAVTDPLSHTTSFQYDALGNLTKVTDADGNATSYSYDAANNLVTVTDAMNHVTRYGYDADNNRVSFENADGNTTSYGYDPVNRLVTVTDPLSYVTGYAYDAAGNVVAVADANGKTNHFAYDALNRLTGISYADGRNVGYAYDADGNRTAMVDAHGTTTYTYDALDRLASVTNPGGATVAYTYDAVGNRGTLAYPDGNAVHYSYDAVNRLSSLTDWFGRVTSYTYDAAGDLLSENYPNGAAVSFAYDDANRLVQVQNSYRGSTKQPLNPVTSFTYVLDAAGNRMQVTDGSGVVTQYGYDPLYELTSVTRDTKVTSYSYDAVGNRLTLTAPGTSVHYAYDVDNRLLSAGSTTFTYDANGNRIKETDGDVTLNYGYDSANRLTSVAGGGEDSTFAYDGDGNRIGQTVGAGDYSYLNDVGTALPVVLQESGPDGNINYDYGLGRVSESNSSFNYFYQYDGLGSVAGLTDPHGNLAGRYTYDAWGGTVLSIPDHKIGTENKFRFTGEALDPGTQLYYLRARYYDASAGRFITRDPSAGFVRRPQTLNRFEYALSNPVRFIDPSGFSAIESQAAGQQAPTNATYLASIGPVWSGPPTSLPTSPTGYTTSSLQAPANSGTVIRAPTTAELINERYQELIKNDPILKQISDPNQQMLRKQELYEQARMDVLGPQYTPPSSSDTFSSLLSWFFGIFSFR